MRCVGVHPLLIILIVGSLNAVKASRYPPPIKKTSPIPIYRLNITRPQTVNEQNYTEYINLIRSKHCTPPVKYNPNITKQAQHWANTLQVNMIHSKTGYGENIARFGVYQQTDKRNDWMYVKRAIDMWYDEYKFYDYQNPGYQDSTGHFTMLLWVNTKEVGVGINYQPPFVFVVMNFYPPGNYNSQTEFRKNVLETC